MKTPKYLPKSTGNYKVGTVCFSFEDKDRSETLGGGEGNRKVSVRMYYPTNNNDVEGKEYASIFSPRKAEAIKKAFYTGKISDKLNKAEYYYDAKFNTDIKFPLILFSHGYNAFVECNTFLCIELASHGYIVASVGHAYEAVENDYEDGTYDYFDKSIKIFKNPIFASINQMKLTKLKGSDREKADAFDVFQRKYAQFMMNRIDCWKDDMLKALTEVKTRYEDYIDFSYGVGAFGHSFGGNTAYRLCLVSDEISCGINIDGALFGDYQGMHMKKPFVQITSDETKNVETRSLLDTTADTYFAVFKKMQHIGFTDMKFMIPLSFMVGKLNSEVLHNELCEIHLKFFDKYLKNQETNDICKVNDYLTISKIR